MCWYSTRSSSPLIRYTACIGMLCRTHCKRAGGLAAGVAVVLAELLGGLAQLGLVHFRIEVVDARLQRRRFFVGVDAGFGFGCAAAALDRVLCRIAGFLGRIAIGRGAIAIRGLLVEGALLQGIEGVAVDAPGGDPAHLIAQFVFQGRFAGQRGVAVHLFGG
jgi:hypothetical protein